jgi:hypothetical protein
LEFTRISQETDLASFDPIPERSVDQVVEFYIRFGVKTQKVMMIQFALLHSSNSFGVLSNKKPNREIIKVHAFLNFWTKMSS